MNIAAAIGMLPGSEVAQITCDARGAAIKTDASEARCPWQPTGHPQDEARRDLWLAMFRRWRNACLARQTREAR